MAYTNKDRIFKFKGVPFQKKNGSEKFHSRFLI